MKSARLSPPKKRKLEGEKRFHFFYALKKYKRSLGNYQPHLRVRSAPRLTVTSAIPPRVWSPLCPTETVKEVEGKAG